MFGYFDVTILHFGFCFFIPLVFALHFVFIFTAFRPFVVAIKIFVKVGGVYFLAILHFAKAFLWANFGQVTTCEAVIAKSLFPYQLESFS